MDYKVGQTLGSAVDATTVVVIRPPTSPATLTCGGAEMIDGKPYGIDEPIEPAHLGGTKLGKRYVDDKTGLEVLCTKPGQGALALDGRVLPEKSAKPLPASD